MNGKITKRLPWAMMTLLLTACSEILPEQKFSCSKGHRATVQLNVSTASETEVSGTRGEAIEPGSVREGTEDNYKVSDFWLLEYGADGRLVEADGKPAMQYVTRDDLEKKNHRLDIQLPNGNGDKYRCVMIANTHDENFFSGRNVSSYETIDKLAGFTKGVKSLGEDTYNNNGEKGELYLNCLTEVSNTSKTLECNFYRNVAKLTVIVRNARKSEMKITGIQICNVPNRMAYADQLYKIRGENAKMADGATVMDMPREDILLEAGKNIERVYYLPRNCQGKDEDMTDDEDEAEADQKNKSHKRASATCVKVSAEDTDSGNSYYYTFYIGDDMANDFNVRPNYHYRLYISIRNHGSDTDSRIECIKMGANCIMMDLSDKAKVYTIHPYKRINKYWGDLLKDQTRTIDEDYDWEATIIWQDTDEDVIEFVESGKETFSGKGKQPLKIKLKNPTDPCNVLIGVRKKGADPNSFGYLWSWHLWVTPYKPDRKEPWKDGKYEYGVTSGSVFRYDPGVDGSQYNDLWKPGGEYYNKYIMDRNLGARTLATPKPSDVPDKERLAYDLYYQFGRKDPFMSGWKPFYIQIHKAKKWKVKKSPTATNMYKGVMYPDVFYLGDISHGDWMFSNDFVANNWNNPFPKEKEFKNKSFFDPCPEGWRIPQKGTWNIFQKTAVHETNGNEDHSTRPGTIDNLNVKGSFENGLMFNVGKNSSTFYPASGFRSYDGEYNCEFQYVGSWSSSYYNGKYGYAFEYSIPTVMNYFFPLNYDVGRAYALPVRCVQE